MSKLSLPKLGSLDSLGILFALLPGLLTFLVVRELTARERKLETVEAVLHGLAYTLIVHAIWAILTLKSWLPTPDIVGLSLTSIGLGIGVSVATNKGWIYAILRYCQVTNESAWHSTWETAFRQVGFTGSDYIVLHRKDGRRIMGGLRGYSATQGDGHVCIDRAQWLTQDEATPAVGVMLFPAEDIIFIQFMPETEELPDA